MTLHPHSVPPVPDATAAAALAAFPKGNPYFDLRAEFRNALFRYPVSRSVSAKRSLRLRSPLALSPRPGPPTPRRLN